MPARGRAGDFLASPRASGSRDGGLPAHLAVRPDRDRRAKAVAGRDGAALAAAGRRSHLHAAARARRPAPGRSGPAYAVPHGNAALRVAWRCIDLHVPVARGRAARDRRAIAAAGLRCGRTLAMRILAMVSPVRAMGAVPAMNGRGCSCPASGAHAGTLVARAAGAHGRGNALGANRTEAHSRQKRGRSNR